MNDAEAALRGGRAAEALDGVDRTLSLVAALQNPQADPATVALALSRAMEVLVSLGHGDRAYGLHRATGGFLASALPADGGAAARHQLTVAQVLDAQGDLAGAFAAATAAEAGLGAAGLDDEAGGARALWAAACVAQGRGDCPAGGAGVGPPRGPAGRAARLELARRLAGMDHSGGLPGAWHRPGGLERWALGQALAEAEGLAPETAFALFQSAARGGTSFDADALSALGQAPSQAARRSIHQTLRLRARRDRLERAQIQHVVGLAGQPGRSGGELRHDPAQRLVFRDFARRLQAAEADLSAAGVTLSGANLAPLAQFQAVLADDEAALSVAPTPDGLAYMCVRRDRTALAVAATSAAQLRLDGRLVQAALSATHAPSEATDTQFPAEAAARLYDALIRPFESCLKSNDRIVWLPGVATVPVPLAALLSRVPPKLAVGYDLAAADWLVRRHAVSYAGSAGVLIAARRGPGRGASFDFLGVGDPILTGRTAEGQAQARAVLRGVRGEDLAELAPLPETRKELEASARGFRAPRVLTGAEATERRLRGELVGAYRYLSFATHGLIREDLQGLAEPALVLTPVSMADPTDDGLLTASEIADLQLAAGFVAQSACNTANFDMSQMAQDLPALASAFAVAGAPSTLGTLWPVNSDTGEQVVSGTFARLRETPEAGAAQALAAAQRAFLAAPPGRAYLHPRFWAPFVVLGEGGPSRSGPQAAGPRILGAETLTARGGEVLHVARTRGGVAARFISDRDEAGRHGAGVRLGGAQTGRGWRRDARDLGASRFSAEIGDGLLVSGYQAVAGRRFAPVLEVYDRDGQRQAIWRGDALSDTHAFVFAGARRGPREAVVLVAEPRAEGRSPHLMLLAIDAALQPRPLATIEAPPGAVLENATVTPLGADLIVTYSAAAPRPPPAALPLDDYDVPSCRPERVTWIERRHGRTGELKSRRLAPGLSVVAALARGERVWLAGSTAAACGGDARATVVAADGVLEIRSVWADETLGASDVRALDGLPDGRVVVAASKEAVFDVRRPAAPGPTPDPYRLGDLPMNFGGMVLVLDGHGRAAVPRMLEAGGSVFVTTVDASDAKDVLLGGTLGGEAAIFHLTAEEP